MLKSEKTYKNTVENLIEILERVKEKCGKDTPVVINVCGGDMHPLNSICLDNSEGNNESMLLIEVDTQTKSLKGGFTFYTQGEEV